LHNRCQLDAPPNSFSKAVQLADDLNRFTRDFPSNYKGYGPIYCPIRGELFMQNKIPQRFWFRLNEALQDKTVGDVLKKYIGLSFLFYHSACVSAKSKKPQFRNSANKPTQYTCVFGKFGV